MLIVFTTIGQSLLISSSDLVSIYLSIELQSFAVYVLCSLYRNSESATSAGLKYFLLGGLSSALILLGQAIIYGYTGLSQFESIYSLCTVLGDNTIINSVILGIILIIIGLLFKVSAAPLHNWAPDVYDGCPTIITTWITTIPKISIFIFLLEMQVNLMPSFESFQTNIIIENIVIDSDNINIIKNILLLSSLLSLIIGTVLGLSQYRIKRLLAYSTISHVGFLLLSLAILTKESIHSFLFYIMQYSITNACVFLTLLAFSYINKNNIIYYSMNSNSNYTSDTSIKNNTLLSQPSSETFINYEEITIISQLKKQFSNNPLLAFSLSICLFSIAGIPPLIGFFAKQMVLYSSINAGYYFISIVCVLVSVISASYYLKIISEMYFHSTDNNKSIINVNSTNNNCESMIYATDVAENTEISSIHSFLIAIITIMITLFLLHKQILLNISNLLALSLFYY